MALGAANSPFTLIQFLPALAVTEEQLPNMFKKIFNGLFGDDGGEREAMRREIERRNREAMEAIERAKNDYKEVVEKMLQSEKSTKEELRKQIIDLEDKSRSMQDKYETALEVKGREITMMWKKIEDVHIEVRHFMKDLEEKHRVELEEQSTKFLEIIAQKDKELQENHNKIYSVQKDAIETIKDTSEKSHQMIGGIFESYRKGLADQQDKWIDTVVKLSINNSRDQAERSIEDNPEKRYHKDEHKKSDDENCGD